MGTAVLAEHPLFLTNISHIFHHSNPFLHCNVCHGKALLIRRHFKQLWQGRGTVGVRDGPSTKMRAALMERLVLPIQAVPSYPAPSCPSWDCRAGEMVSRRKECHDSAALVFATSFPAARRRWSSCMKMFSVEYIIKSNNRYFKR